MAPTIQNNFDCAVRTGHISYFDKKSKSTSNPVNKNFFSKTHFYPLKTFSRYRFRWHADIEKFSLFFKKNQNIIALLENGQKILPKFFFWKKQFWKKVNPYNQPSNEVSKLFWLSTVIENLIALLIKKKSSLYHQYPLRN